jgi:hypothetical protein
MTQRLNIAIEQKDIKAIAQLRRDIAHHKLLGSMFCGSHFVDEGTNLDELARSEAGDAYLARWVDPERASSLVHTALFTGDRCIAQDGDLIEGKRISKVVPGALTISPKGLVAYEAFYVDQHGAAGPPQTFRLGIFVENRFIADLDPQKAAPLASSEGNRDFRWQNDQLDIKPEIILHVAPVQPALRAPASRIGLIVAPAFQQPAAPPHVANPSRAAIPPAQAMDAKTKPLTQAVKPKPAVPPPPRPMWPGQNAVKPKTGATN